jgi:hypothetical protein
MASIGSRQMDALEFCPRTTVQSTSRENVTAEMRESRIAQERQNGLKKVD